MCLMQFSSLTNGLTIDNLHALIEFDWYGNIYSEDSQWKLLWFHCMDLHIKILDYHSIVKILNTQSSRYPLGYLVYIEFWHL